MTKKKINNNNYTAILNLFIGTFLFFIRNLYNTISAMSAFYTWLYY